MFKWYLQFLRLALGLSYIEGSEGGPGDPKPEDPAPKPKEPEDDPEPEDPPKDQDPGAVFFAELNRLAGLMQPPAPKADPKPEDPKAAPATPASPPIPEADYKLPEGDAFTNSFKTPQAFQQMMNGMLKQFGEQFTKQVAQQLPGMTKQVVQGELSWDRAAFNFFNSNQDLMPAQQFISARASIIHGADPAKSLAECFSQAAKEVRGSLKALGVKPKTDSGNTPLGTRKSEPRAGDDDPKAIAARRFKNKNR